MTVALLLCSKSWLRANSIVHPSTGEWLKSDTTNITVPINLIKKANAKMIERLYLIKINKEQDSIIDLKNKQIAIQNIVIDDYNRKLYDINTMNEIIKSDLAKQKKTNKIIKYSCGGIMVGLLIGIISK